MKSWLHDLMANFLIFVVLKGTDKENEYIASQGNKSLTENETPLLQNKIP